MWVPTNKSDETSGTGSSGKERCQLSWEELILQNGVSFLKLPSSPLQEYRNTLYPAGSGG